MTAQPIEYIKVSQIESALASLWDKHQGANTIRASLFNLVIYTKKDLREDYLQQLAETIIKKYPCRLIVITEFAPSEGEFLRTYVADMMPATGSSIFCDVIHFEVAGSFRERIPFVVIPHLLPERPVYLFWGDDPLKKDPVSVSLENQATRTIFDSESSGDIVNFAKMILAHQNSVLCDIADLNWARCAPWRELFANAFNSEDRLRCIQEAKEIHLVYNTLETQDLSHTKIQSIYFQGWLAVRLGWKLGTVLKAGHEICFQYLTDKGNAQISLTSGKKAEVAPGRLLSCDILSHHNERISFERTPQDTHKISMHHCVASSCTMPLTYLFNKEMAGRSIMREIYNQGTDQNFLQVLELLTMCKKETLS